MEFKAPYLPYEKIKEKAEEFLQKNVSNLAFPIDIENIVEFDLGISIDSIPGLKQNFNTDAFLSKDRRVIYLDESYFTQKNLYFRYRFTLAHEVGHFILHRSFYENATFRTAEEWKKYIQTIPNKEYSWFEGHAYQFAGLILVPDYGLEENFNKALAKLGGHEVSQFDEDQLMKWVARWIGQEFYEVSEMVIQKRLEKNGLTL